jgi:hypothetical protein
LPSLAQFRKQIRRTGTAAVKLLRAERDAR